MKTFVAVYEISRHCGGSEEGGWYYDWTDVLHVRAFSSARKAKAYKHRMRREFPKAEYSRFSVLGGSEYHVRVHTAPDQIWHQSTERPHYC